MKNCIKRQKWIANKRLKQIILLKNKVKSVFSLYLINL